MITSRLPQVGTTIFTVMSALASRHQAVNLGQGFPDFDCDPALIDAVTRAMRAGHNQYPPMAGWPRLREAIASKIATIYGHSYDPETEITVTAGATQALLTAILALIQPQGHKTPLFAVHGGDGGVLFYGELARRLKPDRRFYAIEAPALMDRIQAINEITVRDAAIQYLKQIKTVQPCGPYLLCGYSFGGGVAWEMAQMLRRNNEAVLAVVLFDTANPHIEAQNVYSLPERVAAHWRINKDQPVMTRIASLTTRFAQGIASKQKHIAKTLEARRRLHEGSEAPDEIRILQVREAHTRAFQQYVPEPLDVPVILLRAETENDRCLFTEQLGWEGLTPVGINMLPITGTHLEVFKEPHLSLLVKQLTSALDPFS